MGKTVRRFDILISCPSDVQDELDIIRDVIYDFNSTIGDANDIILQPRHWETDSYAQSGGFPQDLLNNQIVLKSHAVIAVFWTRFGSPTERYGSGTEEEIELLLEQGKQVFLYFSELSISPSEFDSEQYEKVEDFKKRYADKGLYNTYKDLDEFKEQLIKDLNMYFLNLIKGNSQSESSKNNPELSVKSINENKLTDQLIFKEVNYTNLKFIYDKKQEIIKKIEAIKDIDVHNTVRNEDDGVKIDIDKIRRGEKKVKDEEDVSSEGEETLQSRFAANVEIPRELRSIVDQLPRAEKVYIKEDEKSLINKFLIDSKLEIDKDELVNLGNLLVTDNILFSANSHFGPRYTYRGTDEEKKKYDLLKELIREINRYYNWISHFEELGSKVYLELAVSNDGKSFDEDVDVKLFIKKGYLTKLKEIPRPEHNIMEDATDILKFIYKIKGTHIIDEYISNYPSMPPLSTINPPLSYHLHGKSRVDIENEYIAEVEDIFSYEYYEDDKFDIISFNIDYLKQNTNMAFPSVLVFDEEIDEIKYEINAKHSPELFDSSLKLRK